MNTLFLESLTGVSQCFVCGLLFQDFVHKKLFLFGGALQSSNRTLAILHGVDDRVEISGANLTLFLKNKKQNIKNLLTMNCETKFNQIKIYLVLDCGEAFAGSGELFLLQLNESRHAFLCVTMG